jgi:SpoVK/Ycf46/Vps4 family AAA+-type ATPase
VLFFDECEAIFQSRLLGNSLMTLLLTELETFEGVAILATNLPELLDDALDRRILVKVRFPAPDREARLEIWRRHLPPKAPLASDVDLESLADRFDLSGGYIKNAVLTAVADAVHSDGARPVIRMEHLERAARAQVQRPTGDYASLLQPRARLEDVVLPPELRDQIEELIAAARSRRTVLDRWGIGKHLSRGKGVSALFFGEPGTGKTLTAEVVAGELGKPLRIAQLPALVSKWVGESEKNLASLFAEARASEAVLFIDEADSLLASRGEGQASRHDDAAVNTLLQLVEEHEGVVLLASNLASRLDKALARRLTYLLHFPLPDAAARTAIWTRMLPPTVPTEGLLDLVGLGRLFALSGGQIKNAVFKAAFRAARRNEGVSMLGLETAAAEELGGTAKVQGTKAGVGFRAA